MNFTANNTHFLNLIIIMGHSKTIHPAGFRSVQWAVRISSCPNEQMEVEWLGFTQT